MTGRICKRLAVWTTRVLLLVVLAAIGFALAVLVVLPRATHGAALTVLTGSMTPAIPVGSIVLDRPVDPATLHVGDIATYQKTAGRAEYITHRIVGINTRTTPTTFVFRGDANRGPDPAPVPATAIRGRVWFHVPVLGAVRDAIHSKGGLAALAMLVLAGYAVLQAAAAVRERHSGKANATDDPPLVVVMATLPRTRLGGLAAGEVARRLGATLIDESEWAVSLIAVQKRARVDEMLDFLRCLHPIELSTAEPVFSSVSLVQAQTALPVRVTAHV